MTGGRLTAWLCGGISPLVKSLWQTYVVDVRDRTDREAVEWQQRFGRGAADARLAVVVATAMLCVIFTWYCGRTGNIRYFWIPLFKFLGHPEWITEFKAWLGSQINRKIFWAGARVIGYVVPPLLSLLFIRFVLRQPIGSMGLRIKGILPHFKVYGLMFLIIAPLVVLVSFFPAFQAKYPFYKLGPSEPWWPNFIFWELLYALQFASLEFFFRGYLVHGAKHRLGFASIWLMTFPYMMIHFGKPLPECIGSIIAGLVLGALSLKSRSIWWGVAIHVAVAWMMDTLSLWHQNLLFR